MFVWTMLAACADPPTVTLRGWIYEGKDLLAGGLPAADLEFVSFEGDPIGTTRTDAGGAFEMTVPGGSPLFVSVSADGYATSVFPGSVGLDAEQLVEDHVLFGVSLAELDTLRAQLAGCPDLDVGGIVYGEVREYGITDPYNGTSPTASTGQVTVQDGDEAEWSGCYLDEKGIAYDPEAVFTGASGKFAVAGVPTGLHDLVVEVLVGPDLWTQNTYPVRITEGEDVVAPWWPLWASFPVP